MGTSATFYSDEAGYHELNRALILNASEITLRGRARFTKTPAQAVHQSLRREFGLEISAKGWFGSRSDFSRLSSRAVKFDRDFKVDGWPRHYAFCIPERDSNFGNRENVFLYFPFAFGIKPQLASDVFSIELINVSKEIYKQVVFPSTRAAFGNAEELLVPLGANLENSIFLYSVFHEMAHQIGPWRATPHARPDLHVTGFPFAALGELSADLLTLNLLSEFPEVAMVTLLIRLFWYARAYDSSCDNDAWIGNYLWRLCETRGALIVRDGRVELRAECLPALFREALDEVMKLGNVVLDDPAQAKNAEAWVREQGAMELPSISQGALAACRSVPTKLEVFG